MSRPIPDSSPCPVHPLVEVSDLSEQFQKVPTDEESLKNTHEFMNATHAFHGTLESILDTIRSVEDDRFSKTPSGKVNRMALLQASTDLVSIEKSYALYGALERIGPEASSIRLRIQKLLGCMNNYDPYINIRGVVERKNALLSLYANGKDSAREQRFAITAAQAMDILQFQRSKEFDENDQSGRARKMRRGYDTAHRIVKDFLEGSGSQEQFSEMGFEIGQNFLDYKQPANHPLPIRAIGLSNKDFELAFITVHQVFETYFEEVITLLRKVSASEVQDISEKDLDDLTLLLQTTNRYFDVLQDILGVGQFNDMRASFGIASGAQSQQYHMMESYIGLPFEDPEIRYKSIQYLIGPKNVEEIRQEVPPEQSLKARLVNEKRLYRALRKLNLALLEFKSNHGATMLYYLPPGVPGSGGSEITVFFARGMGALFPVFTEAELAELESAKKAAEYHPEKNDTKKGGEKYKDRFESVRAFVRKAQESEFNL